VARRRPRPALPCLPAAARMHVEILLRTVSISTQNRYSVLLRYVSHNVHTVTVERTRTPSAAHRLQVAGVSAHAHCCGQEGQVAKFLAAFARRGEPVAYVDVMKAFIYLQVARPSPCLRAPAGRDWPRDMPCTIDATRAALALLANAGYRSRRRCGQGREGVHDRALRVAGY